MIIDTHPHLLPNDPTHYPFSPIEGTLRESSKNLHLTADQFIAELDEAGVDKAAIVQASIVFGYDNSYVADTIARFPDRLVGIGCVDPRPENAIEKLNYWITERGLSGIRIFTSGKNREEATWLADSGLNPFWERAIELNISVDFAVYGSLPQIHSVAEHHPELKLIVGPQETVDSELIAAGPPYGDDLSYFALSRHPNVTCKFITSTIRLMDKGPSSAEAFLKAVLSTFGPQRMQWGSNYPHSLPPFETPSPYKYLVDESRAALAFLTEEERSWAFGGTAARNIPGLV